MTKLSLVRVAAAGGLAAVSALLAAGAGGGSASAGQSISFSASAQAPVLQVTQDDPTAQFHPQGEGDLDYTFASAAPAGANALATVLWPGAAAGNAGTLVEVLGGPSVSQLNDPAKAAASTGGGQPSQSVSTPSGSHMTASVEPRSPGGQDAVASTQGGGRDLGAGGSLGAYRSDSAVDYNPNSGTVIATASSSASQVVVGGVVKVGSVTSSAKAAATGGQTPTLTGSTVAHDMSIGGQEAYLDGSGVHVGKPGSPPNPVEQQVANSALAAAGMQIYFTSPHSIVVGGVSYYYAASILFFWSPPGDANHDSFTESIGGAAVSLTNSAFSLGGGQSFGPSPAPGSGAGTPPTVTPAATASPVPAGGTTAAFTPSTGAPSTGGGSTTLSQPAPVGTGTGGTGRSSAPVSGANGNTPSNIGGSTPASVSVPGGLSPGWWVLIVLAGVAGAALMTRVPGLLDRSAAAATCPAQRRAPRQR